MSEAAREQVQRLERERPDLIPLLRRLLASPEESWVHERREDLDELTRRGLLIRIEPPA